MDMVPFQSSGTATSYVRTSVLLSVRAVETELRGTSISCDGAGAAGAAALRALNVTPGRARIATASSTSLAFRERAARGRLSSAMDLSRRSRFWPDSKGPERRRGARRRTGQGGRRKQGPRIDGARRLGERQDLLVAGPLALKDDRALDQVNDRVEEEMTWSASTQPTSASRRRTCANSCASTARSSSAETWSASSAGRTTTGRKKPSTNGDMPSAAVMILGIFRRPSMAAASREQSRTRASLFSRACPAIVFILSQPRASRSAKKPTPANQPAMSHVQMLARTGL